MRTNTHPPILQNKPPYQENRPLRTISISVSYEKVDVIIDQIRVTLKTVSEPFRVFYKRLKEYLSGLKITLRSLLNPLYDPMSPASRGYVLIRKPIGVGRPVYMGVWGLKHRNIRGSFNFKPPMGANTNSYPRLFKNRPTNPVFIQRRTRNHKERSE